MGITAVFTYTDCLEVYSGDKHFRIQIKDPTQPENIDFDDIDSTIIGQLDKGRTVFRLPFRERLREKDITKLRDRLYNLGEKRPLLFLRHLERVVWKDELSAQVGSYFCHRCPHEEMQNASKVELTTSMDNNNQRSETFLIFRKEVQPPQNVVAELLLQAAEDEDEHQRIQRSVEKLQPVEVAFRLQNDKITAIIGRCMLFSYLSTQKETHLRFIIQARYQTTLARDNIEEMEDNLWNKWLLKETANFLPEVLEQLKEAGLLEPAFFNVLPLKEDNVPEEFELIVEALRKAMQEKAFVPTAKEGHYAKAENVFYPDSKDLRELVKSSGMHPDSSLLHPDIQESGRCFKVMAEAGIQKIDKSDLLFWLEKKSHDWFKKRTHKWMRSLYAYLNKKWSPTELERIKKLPLVRLEDRQHVCTNDQLVFFPPDIDEDLEEIKPLLNDLPILKSTLLRKEGYNDIIKEFLEDIGVEVLHPENLISGLICPLYSQLNKPAVVKNRGHVRYIFKFWQKTEVLERSRLEESISQVPILRAYKGIEKEASDFVVPRNTYLPQAYTGDNDLETYFSVSDGAPWFVDDKYLTKNSDTKAWLQFLKAVGSRDTLRVIGKKISRTSENYEKFNAELTKRNIELEYTTRWWKTNMEDRYLQGLSEVLDKVEKCGEVDLSRTIWQLLVKIVSPLPSETWNQNTFFINCFQGIYRWFYKKDRSEFFDADFYRQLKSKSWIPDKCGNLHKPSECFAPTPENRELLGNSVSYLPDSFRTNTAAARWLAKKLDVHLQADVEGVLDYLQTLSQKEVGVEDVEPIYKFLESQDEPLWGFEDEPFIFIPEPEPRWWRSDEVFWEDESAVFGECRGYLKSHYSEDLKSFFTNSLEVPERADTIHYVRGLQDITSKRKAETQEIRNRVRELYRRLWLSLQEREDELEGEEWQEEWAQIREDACWLGRKGNEWDFFSPQELIWRDDDHRSDLFKNKVPFWEFDNDLLELAKELGVKGCYQGSGVKFSNSGNQEEDTNWSAKVCNLTKSIYDFLNSPSLCGEYEKEKSAEILNRLSVRRVEKLEVKFELNGISVPDPNPRQSFLEEADQEATLWLALEASGNQYAWLIGDALQEYFGDVKELSAYIEDLLTKDRESVLTRWKQKGLRTNSVLPSPEDSEEDEEKPLDPGGDEFPDETGDGDDSGADDSDIGTPTVNGNTGMGKGSPDSTTNGSGNPSGPSDTGPSGGHWGGTSSGGGSSVGGHGGRGGGGEGKEHRILKEYLADNPSQLGAGLKLSKKEHRFESGDRVDILLKDSTGKPVTVEVETHIPSGNYVGVWQAVKYKHLAAVECKLSCEEVRSILAAPEIPEDVKEKCKELKIEPIEVSNQTEA